MLSWLCADNENEYHFICICQLYKQLRRTYIPEYYFERPNMHKFIELISNDDTKTVCNLANFVYKAFLINYLSLIWLSQLELFCLVSNVFLTMYCTVFFLCLHEGHRTIANKLFYRPLPTIQS